MGPDQPIPLDAEGAFCIETTHVFDASDPALPMSVICPLGTIVIDTDHLDPNGGTPIDTSTPEGWEDKVFLTHLLVHEKMHAIKYEEQSN